MQLVLDALTVIFEVLSGLIYALEEVHHVSETNVDLHLIHILENLSSFDLALNLKGDLWSIHAQFLLIEVHPLPTIIPVLGTLVVFFKEDISLYLCDVFDEQGNDLSELVDAFPKTEDDGLLEEV